MTIPLAAAADQPPQPGNPLEITTGSTLHDPVGELLPQSNACPPKQEHVQDQEDKDKTDSKMTPEIILVPSSSSATSPPPSLSSPSLNNDDISPDPNEKGPDTDTTPVHRLRPINNRLISHDMGSPTPSSSSYHHLRSIDEAVSHAMESGMSLNVSIPDGNMYTFPTGQGDWAEALAWLRLLVSSIEMHLVENRGVARVGRLRRLSRRKGRKAEVEKRSEWEDGDDDEDEEHFADSENEYGDDEDGYHADKGKGKGKETKFIAKEKEEKKKKEEKGKDAFPYHHHKYDQSTRAQSKGKEVARRPIRAQLREGDTHAKAKGEKKSSATSIRSVHPHPGSSKGVNAAASKNMVTVPPTPPVSSLMGSSSNSSSYRPALTKHHHGHHGQQRGPYSPVISAATGKHDAEERRQENRANSGLGVRSRTLGGKAGASAASQRTLRLPVLAPTQSARRSVRSSTPSLISSPVRARNYGRGYGGNGNSNGNSYETSGEEGGQEDEESYDDGNGAGNRSGYGDDDDDDAELERRLAEIF
ncbi:hypothetical protein F4859DRAFT_518522 [Xylaria cf. heliscus]|nr:hypothetical protein F4859DRAFT_518522 [Xylaria cf. heliscus]